MRVSMKITEDGAGMMNEDRNQLVRLTTQNF